MSKISTINHMFSRCFEKANTFQTAHKTSDLDKEVSRIITKDIPAEINNNLNNSDYVVCGSVGKGLATKTPWIAILDREITTTTREGVYLVFLFSSDYKHVYLTLNQGTTVPGQFGPRLSTKSISNNTQRLRRLLSVNNVYFQVDDNIDISDKGYKAGTILYTLWDIADAERSETIFNLYLDIYKQYKSFCVNSTTVAQEYQGTVVNQTEFSVSSILECIHKTGLLYSDTLLKRFTFSLMSKRFLILSGLAGSGKTQLAIAFASALVEDKDKQMRVVSVGADWTNREPLLGFQNALQRGKYIKPESGVLDLLLEASRKENANKPYFLILDEMNMSYVERYFADFLSAMESKEKIRLWSLDSDEGDLPKIDGVPQSIDLPKNLFIIGTINVDETTYMFSPKVLDRANVIEFKVDENDMGVYLREAPAVDIKAIEGALADKAPGFVRLATSPIETDYFDLRSLLLSFFRTLKSVNAEFGYRSASEMGRFISLAHREGNLSLESSVDAAIVQKLLPKLHGSRKKLVPVLSKLWEICEPGVEIEQADEVPPQTKYPLTADKLLRMYRGAIDNGFTSFAEA